MGAIVVDHYFPSLDTLTLEKQALTHMVSYRCFDAAISHLLPTVREQMEKFIATLSEGAYIPQLYIPRMSAFLSLGYLEKRSTVSLLKKITGEPYSYPDQRIAVSLVADGVNFHVHTCSNQVDVNSACFLDTEAMDLFQVSMGCWLEEENAKYDKYTST